MQNAFTQTSGKPIAMAVTKQIQTQIHEIPIAKYCMYCTDHGTKEMKNNHA